MVTAVGRTLCLAFALALNVPISPSWAETPTTQPKPAATHTRGVIIVPADVPEAGGDAKTSVAPKAVTPVNHSIIRNCERPNATWDLSYAGQPGFDRDLSGALKAGKPVLVNLTEPYDEKAAAPSGLASWLSEVKGSGGTIAVSSYCASSRGIGGNWFTDMVQHITGSIYRPARNYDATLFADEAKHKITQIAFVPKTPTPSRAH